MELERVLKAIEKFKSDEPVCLMIYPNKFWYIYNARIGEFLHKDKDLDSLEQWVKQVEESEAQK